MAPLTLARWASARGAVAVLAACHAPRASAPAQTMQEVCDDPGAITCANEMLPIRPTIAAPGRVRVVTTTAPRGVALPSSLSSDPNAFFVVDITPSARTLFAVGVCPTGSGELSELVAAGQRADGWCYIACVDSVLGGEPGHQERWRPLRFDVYQGFVSPSGGVVVWKSPESLPNVGNDRHADALEVRALTVTPGANVLTYDLEAKGPKSYQAFATVDATFDPHGGAPAVVVHPVVPAADSTGAAARASTVPANLALAVDDWAVATVQSNDTTLARWQLPRSSPQQALATCDASGCVAAFVFESGGTSAIVVKQRTR